MERNNGTARPSFPGFVLLYRRDNILQLTFKKLIFLDRSNFISILMVHVIVIHKSLIYGIALFRSPLCAMKDSENAVGLF